MFTRFALTVLVGLLALAPDKLPPPGASNSADGVAAARLELAGPPTALGQIDSIITSKWPAFVTWQENYRAANGIYFQALRSHRGVVPRSNQSTAPTGLDDRPTDRPHALRDFWAGNGFGNTPFQLAIDVYDGPAGMGFTVTIETIDGGATWRRVVQSGPETWREQAWSGR